MYKDSLGGMLMENKPGIYEVSTVVHSGVIRPLIRLNKDVVKIEVTADWLEFRRLTYEKLEIYERLFFLKKFGVPIGCIVYLRRPFYDGSDYVIKTQTKDGMQASYYFRGQKFMDKIIKPTKKGWKMELIYR